MIFAHSMPMKMLTLMLMLVLLISTVPASVSSISPLDFSVSNLCGSGSQGSADGPCASASLEGPTPVVIDPSGQRLYFADILNYDIRSVSLSDLTMTTIAGSAKHRGSSDGPALLNATFDLPHALCANPLEQDVTQLFILDGSSGHHIRLLDLVSSTVSTLQLSGAAAPNNSWAFDCIVTSKLNAMVQMFMVDTVSIYRVVQSSVGSLAFTVSELIPSGSSLFTSPLALQLDSVLNRLYFIDGKVVKSMDLSSVNPGNSILIVSGGQNLGFSKDGTSQNSSFYEPVGISFNSLTNQLFITDSMANNIRMIALNQTNYTAPAGYDSHALTYTVAGSSTGGSVNGRGDKAEFDGPVGAVVVNASTTNAILIVSDGWRVPRLRNITLYVAPDDLDAAGPLIGYLVGSFTIGLIVMSALMFVFKVSFFRPETDYYGIKDSDEQEIERN